MGRIGRAAARLIMEREGMELAAVNDLADPETVRSLLLYDSVHKKARFSVETDGSRLLLDGKPVALSHGSDPAAAALGPVDVVLECTGLFPSAAQAAPHLENGAKKVILSSFPSDHTPVYLPGINEKAYRGEAVVSAGSCTTNCLAQLVAPLEERYGVRSGHVTSIHSYTGDQNLLDGKSGSGFRQGRGAAQNIIPFPTGAARNLPRILPSMEGKLEGVGLRVPTPDVCLMEAVLELGKHATADEINQMYRDLSTDGLQNVLGTDDRYMVSSDMAGDTRTAVLVTDLTRVNGTFSLRLFAWHDNEYGYAARMLDLAETITDKPQ